MKYRAFLSYSRQDDRSAKWLHHELETFRTPKDLLSRGTGDAPVAKNVKPVFRDRTDLSGGGELSSRITEALNDTQSLIVLCSPAAAESRWVNAEVETFISLGRGDQIFPVIASDAPDAADVETAFFPPALRGRGLLATDLRYIRQPGGGHIGDGREDGRDKLIAGLLGVPLDDLIQRQRARARTRTTMAAAGAGAFALLVVATAGFAWSARSSAVAEQEQRALAEASQQEAARNAEEARRQTRASIEAEIYLGRGDPTTGDLGRALAGDRGLGNPNAPVTLVQYASVSCIHCANFHNDIIPELQERYIDNGDLYLIIRALPIRGAVDVASAVLARCAAPDRYYDTLSLFYERFEDLVEAMSNSNDRPLIDGIYDIVQDTGMSREQMEVCLNNSVHQEWVVNVAQRSTEEKDIHGVPMFLVNGETLSHEVRRTPEGFFEAIDTLLFEQE